jgi:nitroreductase
MSALGAIRSRKTVRTLTGKRILEADFEKMVDAARLAPSATNRRMRHFSVIIEEETIKPTVQHVTGEKK